MAIRVMGGPRFSALARAAGALTSTSVSSVLPISGLTDLRLDRAFGFNALVSTVRVDADLTILTNPGFELPFVGGHPAAATYHVTWSKSAGATIARDITQMRTGAGCLKVTGAAGTEWEAADVQVNAGDKLHLEGWGRRGGATAAAIVRVQNLDTGMFLTGGGVWQAPSVDWLNVPSVVYAGQSTDFTVESATGTMPQDMTLRIWFYAAGTAGFDGLYDDFYLWPNGLNAVSVHGHQISQGVTVKVLADTTAAPTTVKATLTPRQPAFYSILGTPISQRYVALEFTNAGVNPMGPIAISEWILGQALAPVRQPAWPIGTAISDPQRRNQTEAGATRSVLLGSKGGRLDLRITFDFRTLAEMQEHRDLFIRASRNGGYDVWVVPSDTDAEVVVFGKIQDSTWSVMRSHNRWQAAELVIAGQPTPTYGP